MSGEELRRNAVSGGATASPVEPDNLNQTAASSSSNVNANGNSNCYNENANNVAINGVNVNLGARPKTRPQLNGSSASTTSSSTTTRGQSSQQPLVVVDQVVPPAVDEISSDADPESDDDFYVYRYTGGSNNMNGFSANEDEDDPLAADLPKSFYQLDVGSDSEGATASSLPRAQGVVSGVSGAGQSNLSTEVAALIQSEMASNPRRRVRGESQNQIWMMSNNQQQQQHQQQLNGVRAFGGGHQNNLNNGAVNNGGRESPDFLEMDFDPGDSEAESDVVVDRQQQQQQHEGDDLFSFQGSNGAAPPDHSACDDEAENRQRQLLLTAAADSNFERPHELHLQVDHDHFHNGAGAERSEEEDNFALPEEFSSQQPAAALLLLNANGMTSAPLQSPAADLASLCATMTRSRSLNSPLSSCPAAASAGADLLGGLGSRNKRRHSGEDGLCASSSSSASVSNDPLLNMEVCGARLSQREALVFGVPGSNVHRASMKLRMLDRSSTTATNNYGHDAVASEDDHLEQGFEASLESPLRPRGQVNKVINDNNNFATLAVVEKTMIWTELEACKRQVNQVRTRNVVLKKIVLTSLLFFTGWRFCLWCNCCDKHVEGARLASLHRGRREGRAYEVEGRGLANTGVPIQPIGGGHVASGSPQYSPRSQRGRDLWQVLLFLSEKENFLVPLASFLAIQRSGADSNPEPPAGSNPVATWPEHPRRLASPDDLRGGARGRLLDQPPRECP